MSTERSEVDMIFPRINNSLCLIPYHLTFVYYYVRTFRLIDSAQWRQRSRTGEVDSLWRNLTSTYLWSPFLSLRYRSSDQSQIKVDCGIYINLSSAIRVFILHAKLFHLPRTLDTTAFVKHFHCLLKWMKLNWVGCISYYFGGYGQFSDEKVRVLSKKGSA